MIDLTATPFYTTVLNEATSFCSDCKDKQCLGKSNPYCEKLQVHLRRVMGIGENKELENRLKKIMGVD